MALNVEHASQLETFKRFRIYVLQKAGAALEVLGEVLDAIDTRHPQAAKDEFTLDLVEQCSFQKQRVMHLAITSRFYGAEPESGPGAFLSSLLFMDPVAVPFH
ncbi:hypothetical protein M9H77_12394 [Catharanthus roseus]|uniref:Uncharacterized protein n=1 Tax=Catharanthus roseus TaxID=4058 RepID=A0ACC0BHC2_CATRO|nr:hypothetical protein M9H77_12394 [Catharanthus roseus]